MTDFKQFITSKIIGINGYDLLHNLYNQFSYSSMKKQVMQKEVPKFQNKVVISKTQPTSLAMKSMAVWVVFEFLPQKEILRLQLCCKKFYNQVIPMVMTQPVPSTPSNMFFCNGQNPQDVVKYNMLTNNFTKITNNDIVECYQGYGQAQTKSGAMYLVGGFGAEAKNDAYMLSYDKAERIEGMKFKRAYPILTTIKTDLVVIGGSSDLVTQIKECEIYSSITKQWKQLPDLQGAVRHGSAITMQDQIIYLFGQESNGCMKPQLTIQRLNLNSKEPKWERITIIGSKNLDLSMNQSSISVLNDKQVIVFGGKNGTRGIAKSYIFTFENNATVTYKQASNLKEEAKFCYQKQTISRENNVFSLSEYGRKLHIYDKLHDVWSLKSLQY